MSERGKQAFLNTYDQEHATTLRVLRAYPEDKLDLKPAPNGNSARAIMWIFVLERYLGIKGFEDAFAKGIPPGSKPPSPPEKLSEILAALDKAHKDFRALVERTSAEDLEKNIHFMVGPKQLGEVSRMNFAWFLLHDQIHHRGQLTVYLRMAGGKVPSVYGPTADEPWT